MISYDQALAVYNKAKAPKSSQRWLKMPDSARYLKDVNATHYAIHKKADGTIYFRLYSTDVAVFYPPNENGEYKVDCTYASTQTTHGFMWWWQLHYDHLETTCGKRVAVPYVSDVWGVNAPPTAKLVFDVSGKLILDKSWHREIYTKVVSAEDKVKRAHLRKGIHSLLTLNEFKLQSYKENVTVDAYLGKPFGTGYRNTPHGIDTLASHIRGALRVVDIEHFDFNDDAFIGDFMNAGQDVFNVLASQRLYKATPRLLGYLSTWQKTPAEIQALQQERRMQQQPIIDSITHEDLTKSFTALLLKLFNIKVGSDLKDWGQFPNKLPNKWYIKNN
jgi:hypothetical protein